MKDVIKLYWDLRTISEANGNAIAKRFSVDPHEEPAAFFGMAFNNITMALELLDHYYQIWCAVEHRVGSSIDEAREQNAQRVMMIQKMSFIETMSSFEFCAKKSVQANASTFGTFKKQIYLNDIMSRTAELGLINQDKLKLWKGTIRLRNSLVHNNGISGETAEYAYPTFNLKVKSNNMSQGDLKLFGLLTQWVLNESRLWLDSANSQGEIELSGI